MLGMLQGGSETMKEKILLAAVFLLLSFSFSSGEGIDSGQCVMFNYTTFNMTANLSVDSSREFCCEAAPICTNTTEINNISVGQCIASASLSPGASFSREDTSCILDFTCEAQQCDECEEQICQSTNITDYITQEINVNIEKSGNTFKVSALEKSKNYDLNVSYYTDTIFLEVQCPVVYSGPGMNDT